MSFLFLEYNDAQIKQRVNAKMLYTSYIEVLHIAILNQTKRMV